MHKKSKTVDCIFVFNNFCNSFCSSYIHFCYTVHGFFFLSKTYKKFCLNCLSATYLSHERVNSLLEGGGGIVVGFSLCMHAHPFFSNTRTHTYSMDTYVCHKDSRM